MARYKTCRWPGCEQRCRGEYCREHYRQARAGTPGGWSQAQLATHHGHTRSQPSDAPTADPTPAERFDLAVRATDYTEEIPYVTGNAVWVSDVHVPYHDPRICEYVRRVGVARDIPSLVVLGDLLDNDSISSYSHEAARCRPLAADLQACMEVLLGWAQAYEHIWVVQGNHDDRLQRLIEKAASSRTGFQRLLESLSEDHDEIEAMPYRQRYARTLTEFMERAAPDLRGRVTWLTVPLIEIEGPPDGKPILAVHQATYSRNAPQEARKLWERHVQTIITSHTHHSGMMVAPDGEHLLVNAGCATHERHHRYLHERVRGGPAWSRGFGAVVDGRVELYLDNPYCNRWAEVDGMYESAHAAAV
jgi:predicted phosphodiesterase